MAMLLKARAGRQHGRHQGAAGLGASARQCLAAPRPVRPSATHADRPARSSCRPGPEVPIALTTRSGACARRPWLAQRDHSLAALHCGRPAVLAGWGGLHSAQRAAYDRASAPELSPAARPLVAAHAPLSGGDFHAHFSSSCAPRAKLTNGAIKSQSIIDLLPRGRRRGARVDAAESAVRGGGRGSSSLARPSECSRRSSQLRVRRTVLRLPRRLKRSKTWRPPSRAL